jgi:hypothetical protein
MNWQRLLAERKVQLHTTSNRRSMTCAFLFSVTSRIQRLRHCLRIAGLPPL